MDDADFDDGYDEDNFFHDGWDVPASSLLCLSQEEARLFAI